MAAMLRRSCRWMAARRSLPSSVRLSARARPDSGCGVLATSPARTKRSRLLWSVVAKYASFTLERDFDVPRDVLMPWMTETTRMVDAMEETENIKKPVAIDVLSGTWPEDGAVRRVTLSDGHQSLERVVANRLPESFEYQIWNFTTSAGGNLDYALGTQMWSEVDADGDGAEDETRLEWTYALLPNARFKRRFVQSFVNNDIEPFLSGAADRVVAKAEAELGAP